MDLEAQCRGPKLRPACVEHAGNLGTDVTVERSGSPRKR